VTYITYIPNSNYLKKRKIINIKAVKQKIEKKSNLISKTSELKCSHFKTQKILSKRKTAGDIAIPGFKLY
jgi:hypothetical protein